VVVIPLKGREEGELLSRREMEILEMVANGHSTSEVAEHFGISVESVKMHLERIFEKLRANDPQPEPPLRRS
jgi:LuxR family transcriptional regulator, positive regulator of biofilm formation